MAAKCTCFAVIDDPVRKERFKDIFPNDEVPIKAPIPAGRAQTGSEQYTYYIVDKSRITDAQIPILAERIAPAFKLNEEEVIQTFRDPDFEVPLRADGLTICFCPLHTRMLIA